MGRGQPGGKVQPGKERRREGRGRAAPPPPAGPQAPEALTLTYLLTSRRALQACLSPGLLLETSLTLCSHPLCFNRRAWLSPTDLLSPRAGTLAQQRLQKPLRFILFLSLLRARPGEGAASWGAPSVQRLPCAHVGRPLRLTASRT